MEKKETVEAKPAQTARAMMLAKGVEMTVAEIKETALMVSKSGLFPSCKSPEAAFALMMLCQAEGLHPIQAARRYHVIQGVASMKAEAILGDFMNAGGKVDWAKYEHNEVTGIFEAPGLSKPVSVTWTIDDAKKAKLEAKDNWKSYPRQMLKARVITDGVRMSMPSIMVGIMSAEEAEDMPTVVVPQADPPRRVTPAAEPEKVQPVDVAVIPEKQEPAVAGPEVAKAASEDLPPENPEAPREECVHTAVDKLTWKKVADSKDEYEYFVECRVGPQLLKFHTMSRIIANSLKKIKDAQGMVMVWFVQENGQREITRVA